MKHGMTGCLVWILQLKGFGEFGASLCVDCSVALFVILDRFSHS